MSNLLKYSGLYAFGTEQELDRNIDDAPDYITNSYMQMTMFQVFAGLPITCGFVAGTVNLVKHYCDDPLKTLAYASAVGLAGLAFFWDGISRIEHIGERDFNPGLIGKVRQLFIKEVKDETK